MTTLKTDDLAIGYSKPIVSGIDLEVKAPAVVQIMGPNGAGKTTLLRTIIGVLKPLRGRVLVDEEDITGDPRKAGNFVSYVPQIATYVLGNVFPLTVWEFIEFEAEAYINRVKLHRTEIAKIIENILNLVAIPRNLWHRSIDKLSGGQRQRLLIARALIKKTPIVAMDEPLTAIDIEGRASIAKVIGRLKEDNRIVLITCHDPELLIRYTDFVMILGKGTYVFGRPDDILKPSILSRLYHESFAEVEKHIHIYDYHV